MAAAVTKLKRRKLAGPQLGNRLHPAFPAEHRLHQSTGVFINSPAWFGLCHTVIVIKPSTATGPDSGLPSRANGCPIIGMPPVRGEKGKNVWNS